MLNDLISQLPEAIQPMTANIIYLLYILAPIYIPLVLISLLRYFWISYKQYLFRTNQERILLEIKVPKEIKKTPLAMELVLNALHQTGGESNWYKTGIKGSSRTWFSLELVSIEGNIHFFIWTEKKFKNLIEAQFYAQYPDVEIYEVPDYAKFVDLDLNVTSMWGNEFVLTKDDPYPIKTYVDYGLDKVGLKSDEITDPMTPIIEFLGSVGKGEQLWIQILVRAHKKNFKDDLAFKEKLAKMSWYGDAYDWTEKAKKEKSEKLEELKPEDGMFPRAMTKGEQKILESIERNVDKQGFDVGIRGIYLAEKEKFNPINITGMTGAFKQFNSVTMLNGFRPNRVTDFSDFPWSDYKNMKTNKIKRDMFGEYKRRAYFYYPYTSDKQFVLSSEELATIFHLPGGVAQTPTFSRIESKKAEPPTNLPF